MNVEKRSVINADSITRQTPGTKPGTKLGKFNKNGSLRMTPGLKLGSHHKKS